ncbi:SDR family NAD(P)-dependent oxidoreductase [Streptomyces milbemycinicus]|uniref:SDR family NAD(P)-dependent oxidoreductase n=1 Tax=Streptomyces milbemycinicus TaxID=476552 RepID=A0ABW8LNV2_9ACTN
MTAPSMTAPSMQGKVALVTGATSGIGAATAQALAERGAHTLVAGRDAARGDAVVGAIRERGGRADFVGADLRDAPAVRRLAHDALRLGGGRVDILVNNAGIYPFGPTEDTEESLFDAVYALNVKAPFYLVAELAPPMADRGAGAIVNVSTMAAVLGFEGMALYGSSKAALNLLTKAWTAEYGPRGVRVNAVQVGPTQTETTAEFEEDLQSLAAQAPARRPASATEVSAAIVYLADDEASFVQGAILPVDGGRTAV